ncbi:translocation and assembly module lipoprotein TamL [Flavobacterium sedimenticola]|uniref:BamA/TamA family outer membrane protein n=1 Tax=Flavobacterium sedimenticola TaxID=3043286 RepID=A0ABT6XPH0_9FLAO|nr:BamA/TamA family outer membrane protein [Flavobacterium sedimenticola]MDI9256549.1 BamA/TamA family outer membrane protein [Flavobacterium sedimenticola]
MKRRIAKISLFILIGLIILGCNSTKRVPDGKKLLTKNDIFVDNKKNNLEDVFNQLYQKQNTSILGYRLRLNLYNLAKPKSDSLFKDKMIKNPKRYYRKAKWLSKKQVKRLGESFLYSGKDNFLRKTGEAPVILDTVSTRKSLKRLKSYYYNRGYFDVATKYKIDTLGPKKAKLRYDIILGKPYIIDSIETFIASKPLDSIYQLRKQNAMIKRGKPFMTTDFDDERKRITEDFRNNGAFRFQQNYVTFDIDTLGKTHKANVDLIIDNESVRNEDSVSIKPFELYKISKVNVFTDHSPSNPNAPIKDSLTYNDVNLYSVDKLKYRPKAIADGIFVTKGNYFSDFRTTITSRYLSNLKVFNYPLIQYVEDKTQKNSLIANVYLTPRKKYTFGFSTDFTHSNIQDFGISGNTFLGIRNVFNGAETFEIGFRGNIGSSKDLANPNNTFFNISEIGVDAKLNFPRIFLPFKTDKIIPKTMIPFTTLSVGYSKQTNIGLDKQNFTSSLTYNWTPKRNTNFKLDLVNIQFVKNLNPSNYFNIYKSSYNTINEIAQSYPTVDPSYFQNGNLIIENGVLNFVNDVAAGDVSLSVSDLKSLLSIMERRQRLIENNLIFASNITFTKTSRKDLLSNNFYAIKAKIESAGNLLSLIARASKQLQNQNGANTFLDVEFSQYIKTEFEYIKHWDLSRKKVLAAKAFAGIAIPYGNSEDIPFSRSYFAGGTNDNRAWQSYSLGPGASGSFLDFNEANMKLAFSAEFRFNIFQKLNGALFTDVGNIWNVLDSTEDEAYIFSGLKSLENIAVGSGFGFRYDFNFFIVRMDLGFKTYNPSEFVQDKWFKQMRFDQSVLNIGINYPF